MLLGMQQIFLHNNMLLGMQYKILQGPGLILGKVVSCGNGVHHGMVGSDLINPLWPMPSYL